jgi:hypothetical protein
VRADVGGGKDDGRIQRRVHHSFRAPGGDRQRLWTQRGLWITIRWISIRSVPLLGHGPKSGASAARAAARG